MLALTVLCALLSAYLNAQAAVLQRGATGQIAAADLFRRSIVRNAMQNRVWLTGVALQVAGFFAQAAALYAGSLIVVAPLLTTDLVFLVAILHFRSGLTMKLREWAAVAILCAGLAGFLVALQPHGVASAVSFDEWLLAAVAVTICICVGAIAMRRIPHLQLRAVVGGAVAGLHFAFTAVITKLVLLESHHGIGQLWSSWQLYALIVFGVTSALSMQSMYGSGPLTVTQPSLETVEAAAGILFGVVLFGDYVHHSAGALGAAAVSAVAIGIGILLLASSKRLSAVPQA